MNNEEQDLTDARMLRMKAEEKLKARQEDAFAPDQETDVKKLLHELQVHQIQLEMQNEELRRAYETAETALREYTMLYDLAPIGFFVLDVDGGISELNFTGADILGDRRFSLINSNFKLFVAEDSMQVFNEFFKRVHTSFAKESCEVSLGYNGRLLSDVYMEGIVTGDERKCLLSVVNISALKTKTNL